MSVATHGGRSLRLLTMIDEYTRECLVIRVARRLGSQEVIETLTDVMLEKGIPEHLRSDNGPEIAPGELLAERTDYSEVVHVGRLQQAPS